MPTPRPPHEEDGEGTMTTDDAPDQTEAAPAKKTATRKATAAKKTTAGTTAGTTAATKAAAKKAAPATKAATAKKAAPATKAATKKATPAKRATKAAEPTVTTPPSSPAIGVGAEVSGDALRAVVEGWSHDPYSVLGTHPAGDGTWIVRTLRPDAVSVAVIDQDGSRYETHQLHGGGIYEATLPQQPGDYRIEVGYGDGSGGT